MYKAERLEFVGGAVTVHTDYLSSWFLLFATIGASSSIFGGAKPVDTAAREKEIEQKLLKDKELEKERKEVAV